MIKLVTDQRGSFTVEATFICTISIAVTMALFYVIIFYTDRIFVESKVRRTIARQCEIEEYQGLLGSGELSKQKDLDIFSSMYQLHYEIPKRFPLTDDYLSKDFFSFDVIVKKCDKEEGELVRFYEARKVRK